MKYVHYVRHGETQNPDGIVYGLRPFSLTGTGRDQALAARNHLSRKIGNEDFAVVSSPVQRAMETASIVAPRADTLYDEGVQESVSMFDGGRVPEFVRERENWKHLKDPHTPSWGEPYKETYKRMMSSLLRAAVASEPHTIVVSHQLPIWILRAGLEGRPWAHDPATRQCGHASVTTFVLNKMQVEEIHYWENPIH